LSWEVIFCDVFSFFTGFAACPVFLQPWHFSCHAGFPYRELLSDRPVCDYDGQVARGWESKSVEEQQSEANRGKTKPAAPLTSEQKAKQHHRSSLMLARSQVLGRLEAASNPRHREMLQRALADLEAQIARLC